MGSVIAQIIIFFLNCLSLLGGIYIAEKTKGRNVSDVGVAMHSNQVMSSIAGVITISLISWATVYLISLLFNKEMTSFAIVGMVSYLIAITFFFVYLSF